jgi:hypothetical protein
MLKFGLVILTNVQYTDTFETKKRPVLVLFEEHGNIVCAGITSNPKMEGISILKVEGALLDSVIKLNCLFTIPEQAVEKVLFTLSNEKKKLIKEELFKKLI